MLKLSEEFVCRYRGRKPPFGPLGWVTYQRTYARWLETENRTERWADTVRRVVEGDLRRMDLAGDERPDSEKLEEAQRMYHYIFNLALLPSGRNLWMSGTEYEITRGGAALNNCYYIGIRPNNGLISTPYAFMFDMLMVGGGVGFGVSKSNIEQIPPVNNTVELQISCRSDHPDYDRDVMLDLEHAYDADYMVEDSREGWIQAFCLMMEAHWNGQTRLMLDISDIRPYGSPIRGFGGTSSGPLPLVTLLKSVNEVINKSVSQSLTSVDCLDIGNFIGKCVVSGNVRRSAEIAIGDADDIPFITAKRDREALYDHRWASNNTITVSDDADWDSIAQSIADNGEPGLYNHYLSRNFGRLIDGYQENCDPCVEGLNPCAEQNLESYEPCNLVDIAPYMIDKYGFDCDDVFKLAARYAYRVTFSPHQWQQAKEVIERNRRTGVSITGFADWVLEKFGRSAVTVTDDRSIYFNPDVVATLNHLHHVVRDENNRYADELGQSRSVKVCSVKPSGTVSLLPGVSPGMHFPYSPYYIRRIRFQESDPLVNVLRKCNYPIEKDVYSPNTVVAEFPVKAPSADIQGFKCAEDASMWEQVAVQYLLAYAWSDNAVSATLTFKDEEKKDIPLLLRWACDKLKSTSLLPYSGHGYDQAPYEPISVEEYNKRVNELTGNPEDYADSIREQIDDLDTSAECEGGACPIR